MLEREELYVGGSWVRASSGGSIDVVNPATEEIAGFVPEASAEDVDRAVIAARRAFPAWAAVAPPERAKMVARLGEALAARMLDMSALISIEMGMPQNMSSMIQVGLPIVTFDTTAKAYNALALEEQMGNSVVVREPVGVVGAITPWNYPLHQIVAKIAPAIVAGCTVVLKPSEVAPLNAFLLADLANEVGMPGGVLNIVSGTGAVVGEAIAAHPEVDMVSFTGSTRAGKRVAEVASQTVKRVTLELGGKSACVILDDADLARAVSVGMSMCFLNSGQTCIALTRMLVPHSKLEEVEDLAVRESADYTLGDPFADTTRLGPLVSAAQRERVLSYIAKGIDEGARLLAGGPEMPDGLEKGYFVKPTVFSGVSNEMTIAREEIFGPVLSIIAFDDDDDAVVKANDSPYGLAGAVWSASRDRAERVARRMRTGQVDVNGGSFNPQAPFGGYKQSGYGRELGRYGIEEFLQIKSLQF
ncbi:MAG: aldehyde dehydrogenase family protein [Actinomycetota bacterium]|nr:aldehyde dehydrogenase family protein [Actinomycetota bacterium]